MISLRTIIEQEIRERGPIPFSRYMELCLYHREFGYYSRSASQFGKAGDFYTSSDVHAVFGRLLARQFDQMWRILGSPAIITVRELGPGRGLFAQDVLDWSEKKFPEFFHSLHYVLVEHSPALRERIAQTLARHLNSGQAILETTPDAQENIPGRAPHDERVAQAATPVPSAAPTSGGFALEIPTIVFANEFFDAIPVEIVSPKGSLRIDLQNGRFVETWSPSSAEELEFLDRYSVHPEGAERLEVPLQSQKLVAEATNFHRGFLLVIDYGYTREEQLAGRHRGTLKAIRQHSLSADPYESPGEQDITADVNFTALAAAAEGKGLRPQTLMTQSQFLMGIGQANEFADAFEDCRLPQERVKVALQLKHLVTPAGMGESFHVLAATKGIAPEKVATLSGLSFGRR